MANVGFIGIGTMGGGMARNVFKADHALRVFDLNSALVAVLEEEGAQPARTPAAAAEGVDVLVTVLPNAPDVEAALFGTDGAAASLRQGAIVVDCSTVLPDASRAIAKRLAAQGVDMLDAPMAGQSENAAAGTLTLMIGGDAAVIERAKPVLEAISSGHWHCGGQGMGAAMKVVNNYMANALAVLTAETVNLAEAAGLERDFALSVLRETAAGKGMLNRWPNKVWSGDTTPGFMIDLAAKDVGLGLELAHQLGIPATTGAGARQGQSLARMLGYGRQDNSAMYLALRDLREGKARKD